MRKIKLANIAFMMSALMPFIVAEFLYLAGIETMNALTSILLSQTVFVFPAVVYLILNRENPIKELRVKKVRLSNIFLIIVFTYLCQPLISLVNCISMIFNRSDISDTVSEIGNQHSLLIAIFAAAVVPAICEEMMYRGIIYNEYHKKSPRMAIVFSALLFGLLHGNLNQFSYAFVIGLIFCLMNEATDSILASVIMHFVINCTSAVSAYFLQKLSNAIEQANGVAVDSISDNLDKVGLMQMACNLVIPAIVASVLAFLIYRLIAIRTGRYEYIKSIFVKNESSQKGNSIITIPLLIGIVACLYRIICSL